MVDKISGAISAYQKIDSLTPKNTGGDGEFSGLVGHALESAISTVHKGEILSTSSLVDQASLEDLATAVTNAELTLKTVVAVRDRIISAYQDIKMPI